MDWCWKPPWFIFPWLGRLMYGAAYGPAVTGIDWYDGCGFMPVVTCGIIKPVPGWDDRSVNGWVACCP